ncbi:MAG: carbohydrate ABC transporter permease [Specibacter sp.]
MSIAMATATKPAPRPPMGPAAGRIAIGAALIAMIIIQLVPFYITVTTALKKKTDLSSQWLPPLDGIYWENFATAVEKGNILQAVFNSAVVTLTSTILVCLLGALAAYPLARRTTRMNGVASLMFVTLIMVPSLSVLVPLYSMMNALGAVNTYWGTILVMVATNLPLAVFLYTSFMRGLPLSVEEAASVDGASTLKILLQIVFPMIKPVTATVVILTSVSVWNEYALSGFLMRSPELRTIAPAIGSFFGASSSDMGAAAAGSLISVAPVLIVYLVLQQYFVKGMVAGAEK